MAHAPARPAKPPRTRNNSRLRNALIVFILLAAWLYGFTTTRADIAPLVPNVLPSAHTVVKNGDIFIAYDADHAVVGYAATADATGYGGPVTLLVGVDPDGQIAGIQVVEQHETPGFYTLLRDNRFVQKFLGSRLDQPLVLGEDVDGVSGASLSASAVASAIWRSVEKIRAGTNKPVSAPVQFGLPEVTLAALFAASLLLPRLRKARHKHTLRWAIMVVSLVILGFTYNKPLTIANFASLLAGYWPTWQTHLYWYLVLGGSIGVVLFSGKNMYCSSICPFGAAQECCARLGAARPFNDPDYNPVMSRRMRWVPRWLAVLALALGLAFRQPGAASYEPFGTLFTLNASFVPWALLIVVLFASVLVLRPFCTYLCPVKPALEFVLFARNRVRWLWQTRTIVFHP
ncbi:FMN-binding protein [Aggregatilinea lenta]|uniref:FMN-binding protein n=1 Tax=Aggregatilinea lenta TaxID=913108 RepID=UPI000E5B72FB|nr:FMN-binding protein [Aggregatilinea lenta]